MPDLAIAEYITGPPELGQHAEVPDNWFEGKGCELLEHDLTEEANVGRERCRERVPFHFLQPTFQEEKLKRLWDDLARIESECKMPGWDGYGAAPLSSDVLTEIRTLLEFLPSPLPAPDIVPEPTGAIGLEWRRGKDAILVLSVEGKGVISYVAIFGAETKRYGMERLGATVPSFIQRELLPYFFEAP